MNIPRFGLLTGLLLFIAGFGGGIYVFELIKGAPGINTVVGMWTLQVIITGFPICAFLIITGMLLTYASCRDKNYRKPVGWFFFISGVILIIYHLQYFVPGIVSWWRTSRSYGDLALAIFVIALITCLVPGIIMFAAWKIAHPKKAFQPTTPPPDGPAEQ